MERWIGYSLSRWKILINTIKDIEKEIEVWRIKKTSTTDFTREVTY